ncbi:hypothetical protein AB0G02_30560 [Actinosynnema sp. NPDC023658]|uniref:hypothetical protein n=1 Tax=Actinosynnema sp. NPDC023658 TaxID=3155465 RepID=UPI0033C06D0F
MGTTPLWVPLLVAGMGLVATLTGVLLTARNASRREDLRWKRERERERELWAREDGQRTLDHRGEAYIDFYTKVRECSLRIHEHGYEGASLPPHWQLPAFESFLRLQIFAVQGVSETALEVYKCLLDWGLAQPPGAEEQEEPTSEEIDFNTALSAFFGAVRRDLGVDPPQPDPAVD